MAIARSKGTDKSKGKSIPIDEKRDEMRKYLSGKQNEINRAIHTKGDGFEEESQGLDYKSIGKDKEALVKFYISIGKKFDAPALYREAAILLRKYGMYEEELSVIEAGIKNLPKGARDMFIERKQKVLDLIKKQQK